MRRTAFIVFYFFIAISCESSTSKANKQRIDKLYKKAINYRVGGDIENAKKNYIKAIEIDKSNTAIQYELIGVYVEQDSLKTAFDLLEKIPEKETENYYQAKAYLYDNIGQKEKAIQNYNKALKIIDEPQIKSEADLTPVINYAMLETLSGRKDSAVQRLNNLLNLNWLSESNKRLIENFRNEFEFYSGNGNLDFTPTNDFYVKTTNLDSTKLILKQNHINTTSISGTDNETINIYISKKFLKQINKLNIKVYPNKNKPY